LPPSRKDQAGRLSGGLVVSIHQYGTYDSFVGLPPVCVR
jgi:hypothetical protein